MRDDLLLHWGMEERLSGQPRLIGALLVALSIAACEPFEPAATCILPFTSVFLRCLC